LIAVLPFPYVVSCVILGLFVSSLGFASRTSSITGTSLYLLRR